MYKILLFQHKLCTVTVNTTWTPSNRLYHSHKFISAHLFMVYLRCINEFPNCGFNPHRGEIGFYIISLGIIMHVHNGQVQFWVAPVATTLEWEGHRGKNGSIDSISRCHLICTLGAIIQSKNQHASHGGNRFSTTTTTHTQSPPVEVAAIWFGTLPEDHDFHGLLQKRKRRKLHPVPVNCTSLSKGRISGNRTVSRHLWG